jgi:DMSO/TMAO reductase YedYZ molybdopterin-dependent catalytic subunit
MASRREFLKGAASGLAVAGGAVLIPKWVLAEDRFSIPVLELASGNIEASTLELLPDKKPLIKRSFRAPNYETPIEYFNDVFTPNDAFFVRWHLNVIPEDITAENWRLAIIGDAVQTPIELTLESLKKDYEHVEIAAVCQCSGNRRGLSQPHVAGVQWGYGAMGNARWTGVRLKDVLNKAGIKKEALEVVLNGSDKGVLDKTPDFIKSIPMWKALDENTILAFEMNGEPLPHMNGFPVRMIVPGWTATYWVKMISDINVVSKPANGFWMRKAYRIPLGKFPETARFASQEYPGENSTPITEMVVNSLITNIKDGQHFNLGQTIEVKGVAWDSGKGINLVEISTDGGNTWHSADLGKDYGNFSFRQWTYRFKPTGRGKYPVMAKANNRAGSTQTFELIWNPAGYHNNMIQKIDVVVA